MCNFYTRCTCQSSSLYFYTQERSFLLKRRADTIAALCLEVFHSFCDGQSNVQNDRCSRVIPPLDRELERQKVSQDTVDGGISAFNVSSSRVTFAQDSVLENELWRLRLQLLWKNRFCNLESSRLGQPGNPLWPQREKLGWTVTIRVARDDIGYTKAEFIAFYGASNWCWYWNHAPSLQPYSMHRVLLKRLKVRVRKLILQKVLARWLYSLQNNLFMKIDDMI